jgi:hypothetical protein
MALSVQTVVRYLALMLGTALFTVAIATALSGTQRDLIERVDLNADISRDGVAAIVCILAIEPEQRSTDRIDACLKANGFVDVVKLDNNGVIVP